MNKLFKISILLVLLVALIFSVTACKRADVNNSSLPAGSNDGFVVPEIDTELDMSEDTELDMGEDVESVGGASNGNTNVNTNSNGSVVGNTNSNSSTASQTGNNNQNNDIPTNNQGGNENTSSKPQTTTSNSGWTNDYFIPAK